MERLMQYVWQHRLWPQQALQTVDGRPVRVIDQGLLNSASGPDFFNASIEIDGQTWAGNIEIHVRASDWFRHHHDSDKAYDSVILHVVYYDDAPIFRSNGEKIPQMILPCDPDFHISYSNLVDRADIDLPCAPEIRNLKKIYLTDWLSSLALERIYEKVERINRIIELTNGDWNYAAYMTLARALGFGTNAEPMERLARVTPLRILNKHADHLPSIEALLFGQAGLLNPSSNSDRGYPSLLFSEYDFLSKKYGLKPMEAAAWKTSGMRPGNFPHRRIAKLAAFVHKYYDILGRLLKVKTIDDARDLFDIPVAEFWVNHYTFNSAPSERPVPNNMSVATLTLLIINVVVPISVAYTLSHGTTGDSSDAIEDAISVLENLPPEKNSVVSLFQRAGIEVKDALTSQALICLRRAYCEPRKCLFCRIGHRYLASKSLKQP